MLRKLEVNDSLVSYLAQERLWHTVPADKYQQFVAEHPDCTYLDDISEDLQRRYSVSTLTICHDLQLAMKEPEREFDLLTKWRKRFHVHLNDMLNEKYRIRASADFPFIYPYSHIGFDGNVDGSARLYIGVRNYLISPYLRRVLIPLGVPLLPNKRSYHDRLNQDHQVAEYNGSVIDFRVGAVNKPDVMWNIVLSIFRKLDKITTDHVPDRDRLIYETTKSNILSAVRQYIRDYYDGHVGILFLRELTQPVRDLEFDQLRQLAALAIIEAHAQKPRTREHELPSFNDGLIRIIDSYDEIRLFGYLSSGGDPNVEIYGLSLIEWALSNLSEEKLPIIRMLLAYHAHTILPNNKGITVLDELIGRYRSCERVRQADEHSIILPSFSNEELFQSLDSPMQKRAEKQIKLYFDVLRMLIDTDVFKHRMIIDESLLHDPFAKMITSGYAFLATKNTLPRTICSVSSEHPRRVEIHIKDGLVLSYYTMKLNKSIFDILAEFFVEYYPDGGALKDQFIKDILKRHENTSDLDIIRINSQLVAFNISKTMWRLTENKKEFILHHPLIGVAHPLGLKSCPEIAKILFFQRAFWLGQNFKNLPVLFAQEAATVDGFVILDDLNPDPFYRLSAEWRKLLKAYYEQELNIPVIEDEKKGFLSIKDPFAKKSERRVNSSSMWATRRQIMRDLHDHFFSHPGTSLIMAFLINPERLIVLHQIVNKYFQDVSWLNDFNDSSPKARL